MKIIQSKMEALQKIHNSLEAEKGPREDGKRWGKYPVPSEPEYREALGEALRLLETYKELEPSPTVV